ncbi:MAG: DUF3141 domain-containing protein, partial [Gammaproteobacteria bacterium]
MKGNRVTTLVPFLPPVPAWEYLIDASQRTCLFLDVLRELGNQYLEQTSKNAPHVLGFDFEFVMNGRSLARPINYGLARIKTTRGQDGGSEKPSFRRYQPA